MAKKRKLVKSSEATTTTPSTSSSTPTNTTTTPSSTTTTPTPPQKKQTLISQKKKESDELALAQQQAQAQLLKEAQEKEKAQLEAAAKLAEQTQKEKEPENDVVAAEEEEEEEEVEYEEEEQEEEGDEEEEEDESDDDDETIANLLEPFNKDQLVGLLLKAAEMHGDVRKVIKAAANEDPVHRKIFVHGLGWDTTAETLRQAFSTYGEIEDCKAVIDKVSGKSKGYGFILYKTRGGAKRALLEPQKKIGSRMTACQLAAVGPGSGGGQQLVQPQQQLQMMVSANQAKEGQGMSEYTQRKIYVSNVSADIDIGRLTAFFRKYGEIEEGPLGIDKMTGKFRGFCLFVYKSVESARKSLEEPHKQFEGHTLHCQKAIDGPKPGKQQHQPQQVQVRVQNPYGRIDNPNLAGAIGGPQATGAGLMAQSLGGVPYNPGSAAPVLNPALGQALSALLSSQGSGVGLNSLLGTLGGGLGPAGVSGHGLQGGYGSQGIAGVGGINPGVLGGYGSQGGLQSAYPNQYLGQGGAGRSQHGHMGYHGSH